MFEQVGGPGAAMAAALDQLDLDTLAPAQLPEVLGAAEQMWRGRRR